MSDKKYGLLIVSILVVFFIDKWEYLSLMFFWDEAWVYGNAITHFIHYKIPLLPELSTLDLTRGHPLLFYILASAWGNIFGDSLISLHCFPLLLTILFFAFLWKQKELFSASSIAMVIILLLGNEIFFTQSSLLLPEVLLGILLFSAYYFAVLEKWIHYIILYSLALYTKESAIVLYPVILALLFYNNYHGKTKYNLFKLLLISFVPITLVSLHFIYQKITFGWYFYPLHLDFIDFTFEDISYKFSRYFRAIFDSRLQYFFHLTFIGSIISILNKQNNNHFKLLAGCLISSLVFLLILNAMGSSIMLPGILLMASIGFSLKSIKYESHQLKKIVLGGWLFTFGFIVFSALNFYSTRYIIPVIIFYAFVYTITVNRSLELFNINKLKFIALIVIILMVGRNHKKELSDIDSAYKFAVKSHKEAANYLIENAHQDDIISTNFLEKNILTNANCRYVNEYQVFNNVVGLKEKDVNYYVISNLADGVENKRKNIDLSEFELVKKISINKSLVEIYKIIE